VYLSMRQLSSSWVTQATVKYDRLHELKFKLRLFAEDFFHYCSLCLFRFILLNLTAPLTGAHHKSLSPYTQLQKVYRFKGSDFLPFCGRGAPRGEFTKICLFETHRF
jgi:hypothetical protein